jgi:hypothetical protein
MLCSAAALVALVWLIFTMYIYRTRSDGWTAPDSRYSLEDVIMGSFLGGGAAGLTWFALGARLRRRSAASRNQLDPFTAYMVLHLTALFASLTIMISSTLPSEDFIHILTLSAFGFGGVIILLHPRVASPSVSPLWHTLPLAIAILGLLACYISAGRVWIGDTGWSKAWEYPWFAFGVSLGVTLLHLFANLISRMLARRRSAPAL